MSIFIHPTAVVETVNIEDDVYIGPFCYVSDRVTLKSGCKLLGHCSLGCPPQYKDAPEDKGGIVIIDKNTEIREFVTVNLPTEKLTHVGKNSVLMANVHVPHDAYLSDDSFLVVGTALAGFTKLGRGCYMSLNCSTHQYSVLGDCCLVGSNSFFKGNSPAGIIWVGVPAKPVKINTKAIEKYICNSKERDVMITAANAFITNWNK